MPLPSFADIRSLPQQFDRDTAINSARSFSQGNLGVPLLLLMLLGMMILPLPAFLLDLFFSFNIALSIVVLLVGIYTLRPLDFAVFPTILLVATLMRLALNVASTRVVLLEGHNGGDAAGKVIQAFGEVVIGGNYAVGLIIFIILMIINFVVVTKGAGRISEVSARFTLDAMPGKQMAIDADLNAGLIDQDEARTRREEVAGEADFYGAMDGASKFVRGDAVAGILILVLNVVGGLIVGMAQHELSFAEAGEKYVLLTIGDGLVAQIPSLLLSTSAAIMVTRVNSSEDMRSQVMGQMFDSPKALGVAAGVLFLMGSIPGMPHFSFLSLAMVTATVAYFIYKRNKQAEEAPETASRAAGSPSGSGASAGELVPVGGGDEPGISEEISWDDVIPVDVVGLEVGYRIIPLVDTNQNGELLGRIKGVRKKLSQDVGFLIPSVHIRDNLDLSPTAYKISLMGVALGEAEVYPDSFLAIDPGQVFGKLEGVQTQDPAFGLDAVWIEESQKDHAQTMGYTVVDAATVIATHLNQILQKHAYELLGHEDVQKLLDILAEKSPKLAEELVPNTISLNVLLKVLQGLLQEGVSIRDMRSIAEAITANSDKSQDPVALKAAARVALARQIVQGLVGSEPELPVMTLDPQLEQLLLGSVQQAQKSGTDDGAFIEPGLAERLQQALVSAAQQQELAGKPIILLVAAPLRELMVKFNRFSVPEMRVLAYSEIPDNKQITIEMAVSVDAA
ncbi:flagellar biosynthesis protein FlhA [Pseudoteredinibacter isoporae]|uniref:Flagellar biosynthesis protein FlhA n=1 Tax=Pseudoteredinibacter isoporae TaxID=570281 RepID=A0A7X0MXF8_9GAMM|nr:flagellar biosynthesis protein FlhA [Pseudoteredinibacter isoporae]MBB6523458.1 flagellar biosynthesis protein FlhA [Pseudoteredinibacter isoporae]NHO88967.1 flagellar biosynthesis protein FlhA [Pseudoteredinibacter isoporae]NIB24325.1 flagellar biosynthesis protein FlhA [Pseudoteredinibacter isoporae]